MRKRTVRAGPVVIGAGKPLALLAGPCVIESRESCLAIARRLAHMSRRQGIPLIFKASYDKANRTSVRSFRGPGLKQGLDILAEVKARYGLPILTDVHAPDQVGPAATVCDVLQLPAFLCRQTDLAIELGRSGRAVNIKKAQFMAPDDLDHVIGKIESAGNHQILLTERGACFGYHDLVADMRSLLLMRQTGYPVIFDATHSVQRTGAGDRTGGDGRWAPALARAAVAAGCDAVFLETHPEPPAALSDAANSLPLHQLGRLWTTLTRIEDAAGGASRRGA